jgi:uncharacterized protein YchJ
MAEAVLEPMKPTRGSFAACCARATTGQTKAAPPTSLMNSRRRTAASNFRAMSSRRGFSPEKQVDATDEYPDLKAIGRFAF